MTNFTIQTLIGFPTFCLVFLVLILTLKKNAVKMNTFIIGGGFLTIAQFITTAVFWSGNPDIQAIANFSKVPGILYTPVFVLFLYGVLWMITEQHAATMAHRQRVWVLILLSVITLGFYTPYWFIKNHVRLQMGNVLIALFAFFLTLSFYMHTYLYAERSGFSIAIWLPVDVVTIILGITNALHVRAVLLKKNPAMDIHPILTFLFGIFYLQHQMNQFGHSGDSLKG